MGKHEGKKDYPSINTRCGVCGQQFQSALAVWLHRCPGRKK